MEGKRSLMDMDDIQKFNESVHKLSIKLGRVIAKESKGESLMVSYIALSKCVYLLGRQCGLKIGEMKSILEMMDEQIEKKGEV